MGPQLFHTLSLPRQRQCNYCSCAIYGFQRIFCDGHPLQNLSCPTSRVLRAFMPNLLYASLEKAAEVDQAESYGPLCPRGDTILPPPQIYSPLIYPTFFKERAGAVRVCSRLSRISANKSFTNFIATAHSPSFFFSARRPRPPFNLRA